MELCFVLFIFVAMLKKMILKLKEKRMPAFILSQYFSKHKRATIVNVLEI